MDGERCGVGCSVSKLSYPPLEPMAKVEAPDRGVTIGAKGGKHSSGAGGRAVWKDVPVAERSRRMRAVMRARWAKAKEK